MSPKPYYKCTSCQKIYDNLSVCCNSKMKDLIRISSVFFHPISMVINDNQIHLTFNHRDILEYFGYGDHHMMDENIHLIVKEILYTETQQGALTHVSLERISA